jgi:hypothetical protein
MPGGAKYPDTFREALQLGATKADVESIAATEHFLSAVADASGLTVQAMAGQGTMGRLRRLGASAAPARRRIALPLGLPWLRRPGSFLGAGERVHPSDGPVDDANGLGAVPPASPGDDEVDLGRDPVPWMIQPELPGRANGCAVPSHGLDAGGAGFRRR